MGDKKDQWTPVARSLSVSDEMMNAACIHPLPSFLQASMYFSESLTGVNYGGWPIYKILYNTSVASYNP